MKVNAIKTQITTSIKLKYLGFGFWKSKEGYDDVIIPEEIAGIHYKAAIKARNRWIVDHSDIVIGYTIRDHGGEYEALKFAYKKDKTVIQIRAKHKF